MFMRDDEWRLVEHCQLGHIVPVFIVQNIQSTNWQTLRFKPPPPGTDIGWRVEFRPTEVCVSV